MTKKQIGFFNVNESKVKDNTEASHDENETPKAKIPDQLFNEIEEHVMAKHEYEHNMMMLGKFKFYFKIFMICIALLLYVVVGFIGYKYGSYRTANTYKSIMHVKDNYHRMYQRGVHDGMQKSRIEKRVNKKY